MLPLRLIDLGHKPQVGGEIVAISAIPEPRKGLGEGHKRTRERIIRPNGGGQLSPDGVLPAAGWRDVTLVLCINVKKILPRAGIIFPVTAKIFRLVVGITLTWVTVH